MRKFLLCLLALTLSPAAFSKTCPVEIESDDAMKFNTAEIRIDADCSEVTLTLKHVGKQPVNVMGHNWVLAETRALRSLAVAGMNEPENGYLPKDDARVLAHTSVIGGGQSASVTFSTEKLAAGGDYSFFCSYPGHWAVMKGKFVFGEPAAAK